MEAQTILKLTEKNVVVIMEKKPDYDSIALDLLDFGAGSLSKKIEEHFYRVRGNTINLSDEQKKTVFNLAYAYIILQ